MADLNNGATINSLETYFSHIESLLSLTKNSDSKYGRKYSILPVMSEDDYFLIDANSRTIKVPDAFRKNGLGVQGDQTAETIYFKVNRYFDAMDLFNTDIYIQWENDNGDQGLAKEWVRDIETFDDYMVFGWVLGDLITKVPGPLKFSIRFIKTQQKQAGSEEKVITYSLNTLTAQAMINQSLDFAIDTANDTLNNILAGNFENTTTITDNEIEVFKFVYSFDDLINADRSNLNETASVISADLDSEGNLNLLVSAYVDLGSLHYNIYKQSGDVADPNGSDKENNVPMNEYYAFTSDKAVVMDKVYYTKLADGTYKVASLMDMGGVNAAIPKETYYERYGKYVLNNDNKINNKPITGYYYATATSVTPTQTESAPLISTYKVLLSPPAPATVNGDLEVYGKNVGIALIADVEIPNNNAAEYIWKQKKVTQEDFVLVAETTENSYLPEEEAIYSVQVKTSRNLDSVLSEDIITYYVTNTPNLDNLSIVMNGGTYQVGGTISPYAKYEPINPIAPYGIEYQWYKCEGDELEWVGDHYVLTNETKTILEGETSSQFLAPVGYYRCEIKIFYNGSYKSEETELFVVKSAE